MDFGSLSSIPNSEEPPEILNLKEKNHILKHIRNDFFGYLKGK